MLFIYFLRKFLKLRAKFYDFWYSFFFFTFKSLHLPILAADIQMHRLLITHSCSTKYACRYCFTSLSYSYLIINHDLVNVDRLFTLCLEFYFCIIIFHFNYTGSIEKFNGIYFTARIVNDNDRAELLTDNTIIPNIIGYITLAYPDEP